MAYLVTGGAGFIGSRIVRDLVKKGEQVVIYDLLASDNILGQVLSSEERAGVRIVRGDVTDLPNLLHTVQDSKVDTIIHMAYLLTGATNANPPLAIKVNCDGTTNVFETARLLGLRKVVWASSVSVFGPQERYAAEYIANDAPHYPFGIYGACKSFCEKIAVHYADQYGLDISALRYPVVFARGVASAIRAPLVRELIENPAVGTPGRVPYGDDVTNWLYVDDAVRATLLLAGAGKTRTRAFNLSGEVRSVKEAATCVMKLLPGSDIQLLPGRVGVSFRFDTNRIEEELGFRLEWTMERGIREFINTVRREHGMSPI